MAGLDGRTPAVGPSMRLHSYEDNIVAFAELVS